MTLLQKNLSSGEYKIKTFFSNVKFNYLDLINYFLKDQLKKGFSLSIKEKKIIKIKQDYIFNENSLTISPKYISKQTIIGAQIETIPANFFVINTQKLKKFNRLINFSDCIAYINDHQINFLNKELKIYRLCFLETEDFSLYALDAIFLDKEKDNLF